MLLVKILNLIALLGATAWLSRSMDWEPFVTLLALLSTFIGIEIAQYRATLMPNEEPGPAIKEVDRDTYNKQKNMYNELKGVLAKINTEGDVKNSEMFKLYDILEESNFLFGNDITMYIREWISKANDLQYSNKRMASNMASQSELERATEKNLESMRYFSEQYEEIVNKFHPYLHIGDKKFL